ncbi:MAG: LAGLIDADG family homing endonuclease [Nitrososphaerota archaeon]
MIGPSDPGPDPGRRGRLAPAVSPDESVVDSDDAGVGQGESPARVSESEGEGDDMRKGHREHAEKDRRHAGDSANADGAEVVTAVCDTGDTMSAEASTQNQELKQKRKGMLPRELRIKIYEDVLVLRRRHGLSYNKIIKEIKRRYGVTISKSTLSGWGNGKHSPYNGIRILTLEPSEDLAFVAGVIAGDGYVWKKSKPPPTYDEFFIGLEVKDKEFAQFFAKSIAKVLGRDPPAPRQNKYGRWVVEVKCKTLYELLTCNGKKLIIERIRPYIEHCEKCIAAFLRGFFDSEGWVPEDGVIEVVNTDYKLLEYVIYLLNRIGIETTSEKPRLRQRAGIPIRNPKTGKVHRARKDVYYIRLRTNSSLVFHEKVGFTIERKRKRLEEYLKRRGLLPDDSMMT